MCHPCRYVPSSPAPCSRSLAMFCGSKKVHITPVLSRSSPPPPRRNTKPRKNNKACTQTMARGPYMSHVPGFPASAQQEDHLPRPQAGEPPAHRVFASDPNKRLGGFGELAEVSGVQKAKSKGQGQTSKPHTQKLLCNRQGSRAPSDRGYVSAQGLSPRSGNTHGCLLLFWRGSPQQLWFSLCSFKAYPQTKTHPHLIWHKVPLVQSRHFLLCQAPNFYLYKWGWSNHI